MMISSIPSRRHRRRTPHTSRTSSFVHHPASSHARRRRRRAHFLPVRRAEHCRVRVRQRTRSFARSLVVVHSFDDDPVCKYSRGFNPIYYEYRCVRSTHAHTNGRPFVDRVLVLVLVLVLSRREKNDESQTIKFSMNRRIVLSTKYSYSTR